jgi:hypothetical protein
VAELQLERAELVLHLSGAEKAEAVHGDLRVPLTAFRGVEVLDDAHGWTGIGVGFKVGMRVPGVATVATVRGHGEKMLFAVHGDTPRGVRVRLEVPRGMSGSSAAQIPKPSPPPWRQRAEPFAAVRARVRGPVVGWSLVLDEPGGIHRTDKPISSSVQYALSKRSKKSS